jgi:AcrR family transcriptional regulator
MSQPVKPAGRRQRNAQATRRRVLAAAETLFVRDGYAATTIAAIAEEADVAVQTVYAVFVSKRAILTELIAARVVGDDEPAALRDRPDWRAAETAADPEHQLGLLAAIAASIGARMSAVYSVMAAAAGADSEIADTYERQQQARHSDQGRIARSLAGKGALRGGLSEARATDIMWLLASPPSYRALVVDRGWSEAEFQDWLTEALQCSLLDRTRP